MLLVDELKIVAGGHPLLENASFTIRNGEKVGLVGRNGAGKTSLLRAVAGEDRPVAGTVKRLGALGYLPQDPNLGRNGRSIRALEHVLAGRDLDAATKRLEELRHEADVNPDSDTIQAYTDAQHAFELSGGYSAEPEARRIVAGLGLTPGRIDLPIDVLSGGERRRVELARILFAGSDMLLLDEPTNHLDTDARNWLFGFLRSYRGALLLISHDIVLLDKSITRILHLDRERADAPGQLVEYKGTYSQYRLARRRDEERREKMADRQQSEITRLSSLADSMRHQTEKRARIAKSLDSRVRKLKATAITRAKKERRIKVRFPKPPHSGRVVLEAEGLTKGYGDEPVFIDVSFTLERGERLLVMGLNGAGKTSLLRIIAGETDGDLGSFTFGSGVSMGYYAQEHEGIVAGKQVLAHLNEGSDVPEKEYRTLMGA
ncbi:MAG TPA: ABC-F family ATP-binding cassette domain-containing protein, partial [Dehalococcoidia bacterium]|nr:ABC-F family ATP-binding cassette domain-containing protein [Dehalococcoidia bacterium]